MVELKKTDILIIGGGPAGLSAAVSAYEAGSRDILIIERDHALGGILRQCIHSGFGLHRFGQELTGPEYAHRYIEKVREYGIPCISDTMVTELSPDRTVTAVNDRDGIFHIKAGAVILAMGCRERPRGALGIAGTRPAGIFTAGTAQKYVNLMGYMPGKDVVIMGSGDIGLIMARRMTLEGAKVRLCCDIMPVPGGLQRNIEQCLNDFGIPLRLSCTVKEVHGRERVTGVTLVNVDENRRQIEGSEEFVPCDTLLISCGLIPENELSRGAGIVIDQKTGGPVTDEMLQTSVPGIFACGNVHHVHGLADDVSAQADIAGRSAAEYVRSDALSER